MPPTKVLTYITRRDQLLVLRQPHVAGSGVQVPGGTVEPGESLEAAALREALEETGLADLQIASFLGTVAYTPKVDPGPTYERHFFHLTHPGTHAAAWEHYERTPSTGGPPILFVLSWEPLSAVKLDWEMDAFLAALRLPSAR